MWLRHTDILLRTLQCIQRGGAFLKKMTAMNFCLSFVRVW